MAVDLRCPNCGDNLGKDKENFVIAGCGTCGVSFYNPRGDREEMEDEDREWIRKNKNKSYVYDDNGW